MILLLFLIPLISASSVLLNGLFSDNLELPVTCKTCNFPSSFLSPWRSSSQNIIAVPTSIENSLTSYRVRIILADPSSFNGIFISQKINLEKNQKYQLLFNYILVCSKDFIESNSSTLKIQKSTYVFNSSESWKTFSLVFIGSGSTDIEISSFVSLAGNEWCATAVDEFSITSVDQVQSTGGILSPLPPSDGKTVENYLDLNIVAACIVGGIVFLLGLGIGLFFVAQRRRNEFIAMVNTPSAASAI